MITKRIFLVIIAAILLIGTVSATTVYYNPSADGRIMRISVNSTWASIHDGAGTDNASTATTQSIQIQSSKDTNKYFWIYRNGFIFDTSAIPDNSTITSAKLCLYRSASSTALGDLGLNVVSYTGTSSFQNPDYQSFGTTIFSTEKLLSTLSTSQYYNWSLNPDGIATINKTGSTALGLRYTPDITNTEPTWIYNVLSSATFSMSEATDYKPVLEVTYANVAPLPQTTYQSRYLDPLMAADWNFSAQAPIIVSVYGDPFGNVAGTYGGNGNTLVIGAWFITLLAMYWLRSESALIPMFLLIIMGNLFLFIPGMIPPEWTVWVVGLLVILPLAGIVYSIFKRS
jgi:hypothetical protein